MTSEKQFFFTSSFLGPLEMMGINKLKVLLLLLKLILMSDYHHKRIPVNRVCVKFYIIVDDHWHRPNFAQKSEVDLA